jgi:hypothetical protein
MKKTAIIFCLTLSFGLSKAQQSFLFKIKYLPAHIYESAVTTDMNMEMIFSGDSATMKKIKEKGIKSPMEMTTKSDMEFDVETGVLKSGEMFPIVLYYKKIDSRSVLNGNEKDDAANPMLGQKIYAQYSTDGKIKVDSIPGKEIDDQLKEVFANTLDKLLNTMHFPDSPLKIGDTFAQDIPFNMPIAGMNIGLTIKVIYKLTSVENNIAYFDLDESLDMDITQTQNGLSVKGSGAGQGKMTYDIKGNFSPTRTATLKMKYTMLAGKITVSTSANVSATTLTQMSAAAN